MRAALSIFTAPFTSAHTSLSPSARSLPKQQAQHSRVGPHLSTRLGVPRFHRCDLGHPPVSQKPQMLITPKFSGRLGQSWAQGAVGRAPSREHPGQDLAGSHEAAPKQTVDKTPVALLPDAGSLTLGAVGSGLF